MGQKFSWPREWQHLDVPFGLFGYSWVEKEIDDVIKKKKRKENNFLPPTASDEKKEVNVNERKKWTQQMLENTKM